LREAADPDHIGTFEGEPVFQATIRSPAGAIANVLSWGAVIRDLQIPLKDGSRQSVMLGFDTFDPYPTLPCPRSLAPLSVATPTGSPTDVSCWMAKSLNSI
jgi:hypothetical protein